MKPKIDFVGDLNRELLKLDPVSFCKHYLTSEGKPVDMTYGWKFWADIYRMTAVSAFKHDSKPIVILKGRQVGASLFSSSMEMYFTTSGVCGNKEKPPIKLVHCFPHRAHVEKFSKEKLSNIMRTSTDNYIQKQLFGFTNDGTRTQDDTSTLFFKQFKNECRLMIESTANNAVRLQGTTNDIIFYDEVQHMFDTDIGNANRTMTGSNYGPVGQGLQVYFGTPLQKGSYFWKIWTSSDQRFYHLKCVKCDHFFQLYELESDSWEQIWVSGNTVKCPSCDHLQSKVDAVSGGKWVSTCDKMENGLEPRFVGYHVSQLLIPYMTKEAILKEKPGIHPTNTDRVWKNEILGEFYSGSDLPMTEDVIYQKCRELDKSFSDGIDSNMVNTFLGVDWGDKLDKDGSKAGQSFTTFVVISVDAAGTIRIETAFKPKKNDFEYKKNVVDELFRRFNIKTAVADMGHGNDIVPEIQKEYGPRFIGCWNSANLIHPYKYNPEEIRMTCNSNVVLEELFGLMRKGKVLFPWASFELVSWLIEHCCSMERETRVQDGQVFSRFVKGATPNDGLMSLMYAYLAYKFYQTKGFNLKPHMMGGSKKQLAISAYLPGV